MNTDIYLDIPIGLNIIIIIIIIITIIIIIIIIITLCEMKTFVISLNYNIVKRILLCLRRKEGSVLFNKALNTFSYSYMASDIW